jgi:hypothetical protein
MLRLLIVLVDWFIFGAKSGSVGPVTLTQSSLASLLLSLDRSGGRT